MEIEEAVLAEVDLRESVKRLSRDLAKSAATLDRAAARFLVNQYYNMQHNRITAQNQIRDMAKLGISHEVLNWFFIQNEILEDQVRRALDKWTDAHFIGRWAKSIVGIGPVIAAGLMANIELKSVRKIKAEDGMELEETIIRHTASSIWSFAGLGQVPGGDCPECKGDGVVLSTGVDRYFPMPEQLFKSQILGYSSCSNCRGVGVLSHNPEWKKGMKRPWNAGLKVLTVFKMGESFVKLQNHEADFYGKVYAKRKLLEQERNEEMWFTRWAAEILRTKKIRPETDAFKWYSQGKLPPAHIHARARRVAVKLFLSHYHWMLYRHEFGKEPPAPYAIAHLGHANMILPPNMNFEQPQP